MNINQKIFTNKIKPAAKYVSQKSYNMAKRIIPGIIMMSCSFSIGHMMNNKSGQKQDITPRSDANWAYQAGQQKIKDSLKIIELEQRIKSDSIKIYHLNEKLNLNKIKK